MAKLYRKSFTKIPKRKKKKTKFLQGCPCCGSPWTKRSGFLICSNCEHVYASQHPEVLTSNFGQRITVQQAHMLGEPPSEPVDDEIPVLPIAGRPSEI